MGCSSSTEGRAYSEGEHVQNVSSTDIPSVPGWSGANITTLPMHVRLEMNEGWKSTKSNIEPLINATVAQNVAGEGYRLVAVFLPVIQQWKARGRPMDMDRAGLRTMLAGAMCIFQKDLSMPPTPQETLFEQASMQIKVDNLSNTVVRTDAIEVEGYEDLHAQLGNIGQQGYPLSAIVVDPGQRLQPLRSDRSAETSVHLIYQKNQGMQHPISQYVIINCPIVVKHNSWSANRTADIDSLIPTLSHHVTQGYKIASIYNPSNTFNMSLTSHETQCSIVLEKTPVNYYVTVRDVPFKTKSCCGSNSIDHSEYLGTIQSFGNHGWELAGLIDMPDASSKRVGTRISTTIKLIFQSSAEPGDPGGIL